MLDSMSQFPKAVTKAYLFYNEMRYINLRFTYLLTYFLKGDGQPVISPSAQKNYNLR